MVPVEEPAERTLAGLRTRARELFDPRLEVAVRAWAFQDPEVRALFGALSRAEASPSSRFSGDDDPWAAALERWGAPPPTTETIDGAVYPLCWPERR